MSQRLKDFSGWMLRNSTLSDSSIYKYKRAVNTISNEMLERKVIPKSLIDMNLVELDIAISVILNNEYFIHKNTTGNNMYSNALKQYRYFNMEEVEQYDAEKRFEEEISQLDHLSETEKQTLIKARIGQGKYRKNLLEKYDGKCMVTGIDKPNLLIASHIKTPPLY